LNMELSISFVFLEDKFKQNIIFEKKTTTI
jgi:hypothetical protein